MPSAASEMTNPPRSSARRISRREPASSSTIRTWMGWPPVLGISGDLCGAVERLELGQRDRALRAQLGDGRREILDVAGARRVLDLARDGRDARGAQVGARALQRMRGARNRFGIVDLETVVDIREQLRAVVA